MDPPSDLDTAYRSYRRLLLGAFAGMRNKDSAVSLDEGMDLVHDFFIDEYGALRDRYDPARGQFSTLLYAAFRTYVRRHLSRLRRWQDSLRPHADLEDLGGLTDTDSAALDVARVANALERIPSDDRVLLREHFQHGGGERELARRRGWTRHRVREALRDAMGRVAVALGDRRELDARDWEVARALWDEDRSLDEAAAASGISREQARRASERVLEMVTKAIRR